MYERKWLVSVFIVGLMIGLSFVPLLGQGAEDKAPADDGLAKWTFIVYLDADNNLEGAGIEDMNEMETVGSTDEVNVIVFMDRAIGEDTSNGDWTGGKVFYITKDDDTQTITSPELMDMGEPNMGDPATLINFTTWAIDHYPAEHYILDIWDHGGAFVGAAWDDGDPNDDSDDDWLDMDNLTEAASAIKEHLGRNIDIIAFDACLMGSMAVMYSLYGYTDIAIGSGPTEPGDGWPYERILRALADTPDMTPENLAKEIVIDYVESYNDFASDPQDSPKVTQAAWWMDDRMLDVFAAVNALAMALSTEAGLPPGGMAGRIYTARSATHSYDIAAVAGIDLAASYPMYDIYQFAGNILKDITITDDNVRTCAADVQAAIKKANIISSAGLVSGLSDIYGLAVYFPTGERDVPIPDLPIGPASPYSTRYDNTAWAREQFWDDFLKVYWDGHTSADDTPPAVYVSEFSGGYFYPDDNRTLHGTAFDLQGSVKVYVSVDGGDWEEVPVKKGSGGWVTWEYPIKENKGKHTLSFKAVDGSNQESSKVTGDVDLGRTQSASGAGEAGGLLLPSLLIVIAALAVVGIFVYRRRKGEEEVVEEEEVQ